MAKKTIPEMAILDFLNDDRKFDIRITQDGLWLDSNPNNTHHNSSGLLTNDKENGICVKIGQMLNLLSSTEIWDRNIKVIWKAL
jgi:hypothetical protein